MYMYSVNVVPSRASAIRLSSRIKVLRGKLSAQGTQSGHAGILSASMGFWGHVTRENLQQFAIFTRLLLSYGEVGWPSAMCTALLSSYPPEPN